jgi:hypothetical protein
MTSKWAMLVVVLAGLAGLWLWLFVRRDLGSYTIEYRGERIKLSRRYEDFSTYKNDPNNIAASETARIQQLVRQAPIANSFVDRIAFAQATANIAFPGYGSGALVDTPQSDGSVLVLTNIEIPRAEAERYFTARISDGKYILIDDFEAPESARLERVEQLDGKLVYISEQGEKKLVRAVR